MKQEAQRDWLDWGSWVFIAGVLLIAANRIWADGVFGTAISLLVSLVLLSPLLLFGKVRRGIFSLFKKFGRVVNTPSLKPVELTLPELEARQKDNPHLLGAGTQEQEHRLLLTDGKDSPARTQVVMKRDWKSFTIRRALVVIGAVALIYLIPFVSQLVSFGVALMIIAVVIVIGLPVIRWFLPSFIQRLFRKKPEQEQASPAQVEEGQFESIDPTYPHGYIEDERRTQ